MSEASIAQFSAPSSWPAKRAFFRVGAIGRTWFSTGLVSSSSGDDRGRQFGAGSQSDRRLPAADRRADGMELGDLAKAVFGDQGGDVLQSLHEATTDTRTAVHELPQPHARAWLAVTS